MWLSGRMEGKITDVAGSTPINVPEGISNDWTTVGDTTVRKSGARMGLESHHKARREQMDIGLLFPGRGGRSVPFARYTPPSGLN